MKYNILKDEKPENTIKRIQNILKKLNIQYDDFISEESSLSNSPITVHAYLCGVPSIGTNGKGTCYINAKASAYSELMERLQNQYLSITSKHKQFPIYKDKITSNFSQNDKNNKLLNKDEGKDLYPFYKVRKNTIEYIPNKELQQIQCTNGMAAGNTLEEAIVQGLSEICERYVLKEVFINKLSLPDIPEEYYTKYETINNIIELYKNLGFKIYIKDASLNGKLPVAGLIMEDTINNVTYIAFGAHLYLPIAIERTLTEILQGLPKINREAVTLDLCHRKYSLEYAIKHYPEKFFYRLFYAHFPFEHNDYLDNQFFKKEESYKFNDSAWLTDDKNYNNKDLLKLLCKKVLNITKSDIYIRDVSFLGFPSVYIFIPDMSPFYGKETKEYLKEREYVFKWIDFSNNNIDNNELTLDSLIAATEHLMYMGNKSYSMATISFIRNEYISFLCAIVKDNFEKIIEYSDILINDFSNEFKEDKITLIYIAKDYALQRQKNIEEKEIMEYLIKKYSKKKAIYFKIFKNTISFESIKQMIKRNPSVYGIENSNLEEKNKDKITKLIELIEKKALENTPNQVNLKKLFE